METELGLCDNVTDAREASKFLIRSETKRGEGS